MGFGVPMSARYLLAPTLGQAMLFSGETAAFWNDRPEERDVPTAPEWPVGPALTLAAVLALEVWLVRALRRT